MTKKYFNIYLGPVSKEATDKFGIEGVNAEKLGWPNVQQFQANLSTMLALPENQPILFNARPVAPQNQTKFFDVCLKIIEKAQWSIGPYDDALLGLTNLFKNRDRINKEGFLNHNFKFRAQSVAVVGAGPSLNEQIEDLKKYKGLIVVVDAAHKKLEDEGINPHLVFSTERQPATAATLRHIKETNTPLISPFVVHPDTLEAYPGPVQFYGSRGITYSQDICPKESVILTHNVVGNCAIFTCINAGIKNIGLFGIDYTYSLDGKSHTEVHENVTNFKKTKEFEVESNVGVSKTNFIWNAAARSLETILNVAVTKNFFKGQCYNLSPHAYKLKNIKHIKPQKWRYSAKPGFELKETNNPKFDLNERLLNIKRDLESKTHKLDSNPFAGAAGNMIRMLCFRDYAIYQSKCWSEPHKEKDFKKEMEEIIYLAIKDLNRL